MWVVVGVGEGQRRELVQDHLKEISSIVPLVIMNVTRSLTHITVSTEDGCKHV